MIPYIKTSFGDIPTFSLCATIGILAMFILVIISLKKFPNHTDEENYILPKLVFSGLMGYFSAGLFDSLVKYSIYGKLKLTGITFYGGLIGSIICLFILLKITTTKTQISIQKWFDLLTIPFIIFHIFGRIGCFFGGCCYGKVTKGFLGVAFPDNIEQNIHHNGLKRYPTQLFEVCALLIILLLLIKRKNKFKNYIIMYSVLRFIIEFFRGDTRGSVYLILSPSQLISLLLLYSVICYESYKVIKRHRHINLYNIKK